MTGIEQAAKIRKELNAYVRQKVEEGIPMAHISIGLCEMGCATAFMMGLTAEALTEMMPSVMKGGQDIVTGARYHVGALQ